MDMCSVTAPSSSLLNGIFVMSRRGGFMLREMLPPFKMDAIPRHAVTNNTSDARYRHQLQQLIDLIQY